VKPEDPAALLQALHAADIAATPSGDGGFRSEAEPIDVGRAAAAAGVVLAELKRAEGEGLEEMFLQLTSDDARDSITPEGVQV
jgi:ABC-2 type transport system ATP-binding protein